MKLILATNQSEKFRAFYEDIRDRVTSGLCYASYRDLLFTFDPDSASPICVIDTVSGRHLDEFDGVYINGYMNAYELAISVAACCDFLRIPYVNQEMRDAPSLSKVSSYAKLAAAGVRVPKTYAGTKKVLVASSRYADVEIFPAILKRSDADRGVDNFKVTSSEHAAEILQDYDDKSVWLLQQFILNDGFYLISYYDQEPKFSVYRTLQERPDGNVLKAHMYKPKGGINASLVDLAEVPKIIRVECLKAIQAMNRQIGSVDCVVDTANEQAYILEVNFNPQLVTVETFKDVHVAALIDNLNKKW